MRQLLCGALLCAAGITADRAAAQTDPIQTDPTPTGPLTVEINKFEPNDTGGCRAFFLFRNETGLTFEGFEMSLAIFDATGVIDRLLSIDAAPLPAARTTLKLFEIPDTACTDISEILLHDIPSCKPQNADQMDCYSLLELNSRTSAALVK
jgi:hypothetical protein